MGCHQTDGFASGLAQQVPDRRGPRPNVARLFSLLMGAPPLEDPLAGIPKARHARARGRATKARKQRRKRTEAARRRNRA